MGKKIVMITGADGDIGLSIVERLSRDNYNIIALTHSDSKFFKLKEIEKKTGNVIDVYAVDLLKVDVLESMIDTIMQKYKKIYGLINNAGIYPIKRVNDYNLVQWNEVININLTAPFLIIKTMLSKLEDGGRIINISSTGAHLGSRDPGYSASKAGLIGLTKSLARTLASNRILVNAIAPGTINTKMSRRMDPKDREKNEKNALLKRLGRPEDIQGIVSFLLSNDSNYITGFTIDVNGGLYIR